MTTTPIIFDYKAIREGMRDKGFPTAKSVEEEYPASEIVPTPESTFFDARYASIDWNTYSTHIVLDRGSLAQMISAIINDYPAKAADHLNKAFQWNKTLERSLYWLGIQIELRSGTINNGGSYCERLACIYKMTK